MTKPLLLLDCYLEDPGGRANFERYLGPCHTVRCTQQAVPPSLDGFRGLVLTGSGASVLDPPEWVAPIEHLIRQAAERAVPTLGVCFGHQLIAKTLFGERAVFQRPLPEVGWAPIDVHTIDPLFEGLGEGFTTFVSHGDEVLDVGGDMRVLAASPDCPVHAYAVAGVPIRAVQFHCEMPLTETRSIVHHRAADWPDLEIVPERALEAYVDGAPIATQLFDNWLRRWADATTL